MFLNVGGKEYTIEYTIEASLYHDCAERVIQFFKEAYAGQTGQDIDKAIRSMTDIPNTCMVVLYAGLLEHHGPEGDGSVPDMKAAKRLIKEYFAEHKGEDSDNFYGLLTLLIEQMGNDGFFKQIGLEQAATAETEAPAAENQTKRRSAGK